MGMELCDGLVNCKKNGLMHTLGSGKEEDEWKTPYVSTVFSPGMMADERVYPGREAQWNLAPVNKSLRHERRL